MVCTSPVRGHSDQADNLEGWSFCFRVTMQQKTKPSNSDDDMLYFLCGILVFLGCLFSGAGIVTTILFGVFTPPALALAVELIERVVKRTRRK